MLKIAAHEAAQLHSIKIETDHILIAITKIAEIGETIEKKQSTYGEAQLLEISSEARKISEAFREISIPTKRFRDQLRGALSSQMESHYCIPEIFHRSDECKTAFRNAKLNTQKELEVQLIHLLLSILQNCSLIARKVIAYQGLELDNVVSIIENHYLIVTALQSKINPELN